VAILLVLFHNLSIFAPRGTIFDKLWNAFVESGWVGVQLFFVLSGFLITGILLDDRERPRAIRVFYIRRSLRIFPLYYALLLFYFLVLPQFFPVLQRPRSETGWYWLYLSNWSWLAYGILPGIGHLWSLAVEEQFYIVWPWVTVRTVPKTLAWICVAVVVGSLGARSVLHRLHFSDLWLYSATISRADALAMGALVALAFRSEVWRPRLVRALRPLGVFAALALAALIAVTHGMNRNNPLMQIWGYSLIAIGSAVVVAAAARPEAMQRLDSKALRLFGKYSYGIYLVHPPIKHAVHHFFRPQLEAMVEARPIATDVGFIGVVTVASIAVALTSWYALEQPLLRLKDRLAPR
jgi:peptidoglycan/LPS O-acetylase OafA/YrhL